MKTKISDKLADEIIKSLLESRDWMGATSKERYRGHTPNDGDPLWYAGPGDGYIYRLDDGEADLRAIHRMLAERHGEYTIGIDPAFAMRFNRAAMRLIQSGRLVLCYDDGRKIVRIPADADKATGCK